MKEHDSQVRVVMWAKLNEERVPALKNLFAIPNGARTKTLRHASALKAEGLKKGVPDLFLACPVPGYHGLFIEMKRESGAGARDSQVEWICRLNNAGYHARVCFGHEHAIKSILKYLSLRFSIQVKMAVGGIVPITILGCDEKVQLRSRENIHE